MKISKNQLIDRMCLAWDSEYNNIVESKTDHHSAGMTESQRYVLRKRMEKVLDSVLGKEYNVVIVDDMES